MATSTSEAAPSTMVKRLNWIRIDEAGDAQHGEKHLRLGHADLAGGNGPRGGARDAGIVVPVDDVVIGAAGAAHHEGAGEEQRQIPRLGIGRARARARPAPAPTSTETAAARRRSGDRSAPGADKAAMSPAPYGRPNCRAARRGAERLLASVAVLRHGRWIAFIWRKRDPCTARPLRGRTYVGSDSGARSEPEHGRQLGERGDGVLRRAASRHLGAGVDTPAPAGLSIMTLVQPRALGTTKSLDGLSPT